MARNFVGEAWRAAVVGMLCVGMVAPAEMAVGQPAVGKKTKAGGAAAGSKLTGEQRDLHVLNRLTFGPGPGDLAAVERMGLEAWFQQQLHPERIADAGFEARLAQFPAMRLTQAELVEQFPTPEMLRRYTRGGLAMPDDPTERVVYADAALSYEEKREAKAAAKGADAGAAGAATPGTAASAGMVAAAGPGSGTRGAAPIVRVGPGDGMAGAGMAGAAMVGSATGTGVNVAAAGVGSGSEGVAAMAPAEKEAVLAMPAGARLARLRAMSPEQMASFQASLKGPDQGRLYTGMTPAQIELTGAMKSPERVVGAEAVSVRLLRDVYSQRQLQAVMTDFWLNHFSVYLRKNQNEPYLLPAYERDAVLPNALGKFEDLLVATAESPAMLVYLDNWESVGPDSKAAGRAAWVQKNRPAGAPLAKIAKRMPQGINENYARELMELHTLGVNGGYTQQDVIEVAKCFTGWTIDRPAQGGEFLFNPNRHEPGDKVVLGHVIKEGGMNEGLEVLHILATSPATAHFVSEKLAERFVSDAPPAAMVDRMAATFLRSGGDIKAVLTTMFHSPEFWTPGVYRAKVKTPLEFVASALRATGAQVTNPVPLVQAMDRLGMPIYGMQTPNGYSWEADAWVSSNALLTRMNFALVLSGNRVQGTRLDWPSVVGGEAGAVDAAAVPDAAEEARLEQVLLGQPAAAQTREAAMAEAATPGVQGQAEASFRATPGRTAEMAQVERTGEFLPVKAGKAGRQAPPMVVTTPETPLATVAGLLLGSPDFQRR